MIKIEKLSDKSLSLWYFGLAILIYATAINNPFHFDDFHSIVENPHLRNLKNIPIFFVDTQTFSVEQGGKMFRPLLLTSFAINYAIHGYEVWGYRAFNILLHVSCVIALFRFAMKMGSDKKMAVLMGCLFLINPIVNIIVTHQLKLILREGHEKQFQAHCKIILIWTDFRALCFLKTIKEMAFDRHHQRYALV